jgi:hypothetical protein
MRDCRISRNGTLMGRNMLACGVQITGGTLLRCTLDHNKPVSNYGYTLGTGLYMSGGTVEDCDIFGNSCDRNQIKGTALYISGGTLAGCRIVGNPHVNTDQIFGAVHMTGGTVENCLIATNGINGVYMENGTLRNCLVRGHGAGSASTRVEAFAGVCMLNSSVVINCTITGNVLSNDTTGCSGLRMKGGRAVNNIVWGNGPDSAVLGSTYLTDGIFNTNLVDVAAAIGTGNIVADPRFVRRAAGNYRLVSASPAVNAGDNGVWDGFVEPVDLDGNARIHRKIVDLGCYECHVGGGLIIQLR